MKWYKAVAILCLMATIAFFIDIYGFGFGPTPVLR